MMKFCHKYFEWVTLNIILYKYYFKATVTMYKINFVARENGPRGTLFLRLQI